MISVQRRLAVLACAVSLLSACDVATVPSAPSTIAQNHCNSDSACGSGGACLGNQCRSLGSALQSLLFEVTPPADGSPIAGVQFRNTVNPLPSAGSTIDLVLDPISQVVGRVTIAGRKCADAPIFYNGTTAYAKDTTGGGSIPAFVTLTRSQTALGLYSSAAVVKSNLTNSSYYSFSVNVPPGDYDVYVEPESQMDDSCPVPPLLRRGQHFNGGSLLLEIPLPEPSSFELHVSWPLANGALDGWTVDMLDPVSGRVLSNRVSLATSNSKKDDYVATLVYSPVLIGEPGVQETEQLVRLSPPDDGRARPTVLLARSALGLFNANAGTLTQFTSLPDSVHLQGQVAAEYTPDLVASTVTLVATKLAGIDPGVLASFVRTVVVGADGQFEVDLLPGTYRVSAVPGLQLGDTRGKSPLAAVSEDWVVGSSPAVQAGKLVTLAHALPISGSVKDASNVGVATALVQAIASPASLQSDVLEQALGEASFVPRASTGSVGQNGVFSLLADTGTFDVSVRPLASTGFAWLVSPNVSVGANAGPNLVETIPLPVVYSGTVKTAGDDQSAVPNALIRAYIYLSKGQCVTDPSKADSVLQVAEAQADGGGGFEILIPAQVNAPGCRE